MKDYHAQQNLTREALLKNDAFLTDAAIYMGKRTRRTFETDEELFDAFVEQMRMSSVNEVDAYRDFDYIRKANDVEKNRAGKLFLAFDRVENPTSVMKLIGDYGEGLLTAPSTYLSVIPGLGIAAKLGITGATSLMAKGAAFGATRTINQTAKALASTNIKKRALGGALSAGAVEGTVGAVQGGLYGAARKDTGVEEYKDVSVGKYAGVGFLAGAVPGVVIGGGIAAKTAMQERKAMELLSDGIKARSKRLEFGSKAVAKLQETNREMYNAVSKRLDPLAERLGKELEEGASLKQRLTPDFMKDHFEVKMNADVIRNMKGAAVEILLAAGVKDIPATARLSEIMWRALTKQGALATDDMGVEVVGGKKLMEIMDKYGLTQDQLANIFLAEMSEAGRTLSLGGHSRKKLLQQLSNEHKIIDKMQLGDETFQRALEVFEKTPGRARELIKNMDKFRLGLMTIQTATTARNTANATGRTFLFALDNLGHGVLDMATGKIAKGAARAGSGMRLFRSMTWNQSEANALRLLFADEMPRTFGRLYMQNADVAAAMGFGSGFANFSRKLNVLNTVSDNAFKRAVFMSELQSLVGVKELRKLMKEGKFSTIDKETIAKAMNEALSFTYQKSYRGINGKKTKASGFLELLSTPATTWLIPFPKFIMNSVEFMWTHAPILGLASKGGTKEKLAKQLTGTGMLYGAIQLRAQQGPDAKWWEWYDEETGEYENALAFYGPFAPYMFAADLILRSNMRNKTVSDATGLPLGDVPLVVGEQTRKNWARVAEDSFLESMFKDPNEMLAQFNKSVFGTTFRTGTGLEMINALHRDLETSIKGANYGGFKRTIATFGGNYLNTFTVGMGEVRDIYGLVDPQYRIIQDPEAEVNPFDLFVAKATRSLPISMEGKYFGLIKGKDGTRVGTPARSATSGELLTRERSGRKQLTGRGTVRTKDIVRKALDFHKIPSYRAFPKLKEPDLDKMAKDLYNEYTEKRLVPLLAGAEYRNQPETPRGGYAQKLMLKQSLDLSRSDVYNHLISTVGQKYTKLVNEHSDDVESIKKAENQLTFLFKLKFSELPDGKREIGEIEYLKDNDPPTSWEDYRDLYARAAKVTQ